MRGRISVGFFRVLRLLQMRPFIPKSSWIAPAQSSANASMGRLKSRYSSGKQPQPRNILLQHQR